MSTTFILGPRSLADGSFAPQWFDSKNGLWKDPRLLSEAPLADSWKAPADFVARPRGHLGTGVLFNPEAFAVDESVRAALHGLSGVEFLPVSVRGLGSFFLVHPISAVDLSGAIKPRVAPPPSGNIVEVLGFGAGFVPPSDVFRVRHPPESAAGRLGYCNRTVLVSRRAAEVIQQAADAWLELEPAQIVD